MPAPQPRGKLLPALDLRDVEAKSASNSTLASADSPPNNLAGPSRNYFGAAAYSPETAARSPGPAGMSTALPTSQALAEGLTTPVPQAADIQEAPNHTDPAQQTAVTEVIQGTGTFLVLQQVLGCLPLE